MSELLPEDLKEEFRQIVFKKLSAVETDAATSNQHEFNASRALLTLFGKEQPQRFNSQFFWLSNDGAVVQAEGNLTWYDSRARNPTRSEYRLYYKSNPVTKLASEGDFLIIARRTNGATLVLLSPGTGVAALTLSNVFGIETEPGRAFASLSFVCDPDNAGNEPLNAWRSEEAASFAQSDRSLIDKISKVQNALGKDRGPIVDNWLDNKLTDDLLPGKSIA